MFTLPRTDAAICFAGDTYFAYPLIAQISQAIQSHFPLRDRAMDYVPFRTQMVKLLNAIVANYQAYVEEMKNPDTAFLLGGYSWFRKEFCIDKISFNKGLGRFEHKTCESGIGNFGKILFIGDWAREASHRLHSILRKKYGEESLIRGGPIRESLGYEPLAVVRDLLRGAGANDTIGGAPQIVAVAQHMNARHTAVFWPNKEAGKIFVGGRPVFDFENIENWIMDPDTFESVHLHFGFNGVDISPWVVRTDAV